LGYGSVRSVECEIKETETGAEILAMPSFALAVEAWINEPLTLYTDAYAEGYSFSITSKALCNLRFLGAALGSFTVTGEMPIREEALNRTPLSAKIIPISSSLSLSGNQAVVSGECKASVLFERGEGEEGEASEESFLFPYRLTLTMPTPLYETDSVEYRLQPLFATVKQDKGTLSVMGEVMLSAKALRSEKLSLPEKIDAEALPTPKDENDIRIYYPTPKDTLWSVGKRYNLSLEALASLNDIPNEVLREPDNPKSLDGVAWLLVRAL
jgi:hypothetical protein